MIVFFALLKSVSLKVVQLKKSQRRNLANKLRMLAARTNDYCPFLVG
jgi:hypothetical protein